MGPSSLRLSGARLWPAESACHWPDLHSNFHEKLSTDDPGVWKCSWCERMLLKFTIVAQSEDGKVFDGYDKLTGRRWKLRGTESWGRDAWKLPTETATPFRL